VGGERRVRVRRGSDRREGRGKERAKKGRAGELAPNMKSKLYLRQYRNNISKIIKPARNNLQVFIMSSIAKTCAGQK